jgi:hypothetical protein
MAKRSWNKPSVFQIKVALKDMEPEIWHRLLVPCDTTLDQLHFMLNEGYERPSSR